MKGWVYVISNKGKPGLVKVGYSSKDPELRARELDSTADPHPHLVDYEVIVENPHQIEQQAHARLSDKHEGKEWFRTTAEDAATAIRSIAGERIIAEDFKLSRRPRSEELRKNKEVKDRANEDANWIDLQKQIREAIAKKINRLEDLKYHIPPYNKKSDIEEKFYKDPECDLITTRARNSLGRVNLSPKNWESTLENEYNKISQELRNDLKTLYKKHKDGVDNNY